MKKSNLYLLIFIGLFLGACTSQETKEYIAKVQNQRDEKNTEYADSTKSPLNPAHLAEFNGLDYFAIDPKFRITAKLEQTPDELPYELTTSTDRRPIYRKYGILHFEINGKPCELSVLQNMKFVDDSIYGNLLFIAFQDLTSSKESYGGGRYIDIEIPETETVIVDFNDAYNPYCAYHDRWSCVIPPPENFLEVEIRAGEKKFHLSDH